MPNDFKTGAIVHRRDFEVQRLTEAPRKNCDSCLWLVTYSSSLATNQGSLHFGTSLLELEHPMSRRQAAVDDHLLME